MNMHQWRTEAGGLWCSQAWLPHGNVGGKGVGRSNTHIRGSVWTVGIWTLGVISVAGNVLQQKKKTDFNSTLAERIRESRCHGSAYRRVGSKKSALLRCWKKAPSLYEEDRADWSISCCIAPFFLWPFSSLQKKGLALLLLRSPGRDALWYSLKAV